MFVGHYGIAFLLRKRFKQAPLWLSFVFVQLVDILAFVFVLLGIERIAYRESPNPFLRTAIEYVPYSHSLFANAILASAVLLIFWKLKDRTWGIALSVGVLSHWFLDSLVHVRDIPLLHDSFKVGFGLWQFPRTSFLIETAFLISAGYYLLKGSKRIGRHVGLIILLMVGYSAMFFAPEAEATPTQASVVSLSLYAAFSGLAYWAERKK